MKQDVTFTEFITWIVSALEAVGVEYMLGGAIAAWVWGEYRSTADVDVVVNLPEDVLEPLSAELIKHDIMVPADIMRDIIKETRIDLPINAIHGYSGHKAELFPLRPGDDLRASALKRRRLADLGEKLGKLYVHSPEDLILYKMQYYSISRQPKHSRDISSILTSSMALDTGYIETWADKKGWTSIWKEMHNLSGKGSH